MFYTEIAQDFSEIKILSDTLPDAKVLIFKDSLGNIISTHVEGGSQTINGINYTTFVSANDLNFSLIATSIGLRYIYNLNQTTIGKPLTDGVFEIILISETETIVLNVFLYNLIQCCLAKKLSKYYCRTTEIEEVINMTAVIEAVKAAVNVNLFEQAVCGFKILENYCKNCGCK